MRAWKEVCSISALQATLNLWGARGWKVERVCGHAVRMWWSLTSSNSEPNLVMSKSESCSVVSDSLWPHGLYSPWNSPGQNIGVGNLSRLQGIFPTQGLNLGLPHCRQEAQVWPSLSPHLVISHRQEISLGLESKHYLCKCKRQKTFKISVDKKVGMNEAWTGLPKIKIYMVKE